MSGCTVTRSTTLSSSTSTYSPSSQTGVASSNSSLISLQYEEQSKLTLARTRHIPDIRHTNDIQYSPYRASAQAQRLQWVHHHQPGLSTHTRQNQTHSWHCHTSDNRHSPYRAFSPGQANLPVYNESININQDTSPWGFTQVTSFPQRPELDINQDTSPWGFTQVTSFHQRQVFGHQPGQSPWGFLLKSWVFLRNQKLDISQDNHTEVFAQVTSFPQRPDFGHQPSRDRDKLYSISMRQVSNIWKSFNATLSDSNPSHAPQSRVSVKETDFVNGRNMLNWTV